MRTTPISSRQLCSPGPISLPTHQPANSSTASRTDPGVYFFIFLKTDLKCSFKKKKKESNFKDWVKTGAALIHGDVRASDEWGVWRRTFPLGPKSAVSRSGGSRGYVREVTSLLPPASLHSTDPTGQLVDTPNLSRRVMLPPNPSPSQCHPLCWPVSCQGSYPH